MLGAAAVLAACAWVLEAPITGEETAELISIRKIAENSFISIDGIMPEPAAVTTYVITPYYFFVALAAKAAGVSIFVAYLKLRALYAGLALVTLAALAGRIFRAEARLPAAVALGTVALVAIDPDPWSWPASVFPLVRRGGIAVGLLAPALMLAMAVYVDRDAPRTRLEWLAPGMLLLALLTTHATEILYAGFFAMALGAAGLLVARSGVSWSRLAACCASAAAVAVAYRLVHPRLAAHVYAFDEGGRADAQAALRAAVDAGPGAAFTLSEVWRYLISASGAVVPYAVLGLLLVPALIRVDPSAGVIVWSAVLVPLVVYGSGALFALLQLATSSEVLFVFSYFTVFGVAALL